MFRSAVVRRKRRLKRIPLLRCLLSWVINLVIVAIGVSFLLVLPLRWVAPPTSSFMLQSFFASETEGWQPYRYRWAPYDTIAPEMALATIAAEDQRFPDHNGFDLKELEQAIEDYQQGEALRGASTISQQVAKNLYLWSGRSALRKSLEAWLTVLIELLWSKQRILEIYLNVAQFGSHTFGVEAASLEFFDKSASELFPEEAALLAAVLPGPELYRVDQPSLQVLQRQDWILQQMNQLGGVAYLNTIE